MTQAVISRSYLLQRSSLLSRLSRMRAARRQRLALGRMDDARLADIGLTRAEALQESRRSFWDAPESWKC